jgi:hypothetical protein
MEIYEMDVRDSFPWDMVRKGSQIGLRTMGLPPEWGSVGADYLT